MNTIIVLVGVGGAGKSTLLAHAKGLHGVKVLQPSTTRPKRAGESDEYHFLEKAAWIDADHAWKIDARGNFYGLRNSELNTLQPGVVGLTVFHPGNLDTLEQFRKSSIFEFVTVGIDTVDTHAELKQRTNNQPERDEGEPAFINQRKTVKTCDCVLHGDIKAVTDALVSTILALKSKGVLDKQSITNLINSGTLLGDAHIGNVQPASYDLCVGNIVWCQGKRNDLQPNAVIKIPPYSYVVVEAHEKAILPKFVIAHYDLKVSLFAQGIILSNGPQVDPGYGGVLLCMLFNGSDNDVAIKRGEHFATVEFLITSRVTEGYKGEHQNQDTLDEFMHATALNSSGGNIIEKINSFDGRLETYRNVFILAMIVAGIGAIFAFGPWASDRIEKINQAKAQADLTLETMTNMTEKLGQAKSQVDIMSKQLSDLISESTNLLNQLRGANIQNQSPTTQTLTNQTSK
jgi:deoxycytidine triphosphate deaminase/guanylate kinase